MHDGGNRAAGLPATRDKTSCSTRCTSLITQRMAPMRAYADAMRLTYRNPVNPIVAYTIRRARSPPDSSCSNARRDVMASRNSVSTRPRLNSGPVSVHEKVVWSRPFCDLIHFERTLPANHRPDPKILIVAPMSGHYATLLRGTVEALLPKAEVYITDWTDARMVPVTEGRFDLDDYIDYVISMLHALGPDTHVLAVCQPSVPVLAAVAVMEESGDTLSRHRSMTLMGGPIDTRINPTGVNELAQNKPTGLVRRQCDHAGAVAAAGLHPCGLSGLPAACRAS
jgi:poly(3-hydroxybutyrate) depolymerase